MSVAFRIARTCYEAPDWWACLSTYLKRAITRGWEESSLEFSDLHSDLAELYCRNVNPFLTRLLVDVDGTRLEDPGRFGFQLAVDGDKIALMRRMHSWYLGMPFEDYAHIDKLWPYPPIQIFNLAEPNSLRALVRTVRNIIASTGVKRETRLRAAMVRKKRNRI